MSCVNRRGKPGGRTKSTSVTTSGFRSASIFRQRMKSGPCWCTRAGDGGRLVVTAVFTGLRASELRGLRWEDVDLDHGELTVRQRADRWGSIGSPKSDAGKRIGTARTDGRQRAEGVATRLPEGSARPCVPEWQGEPGADYRDPLPRALGHFNTPPASRTPTSRNTACTAFGMPRRACLSNTASRQSGCRR